MNVKIEKGVADGRIMAPASKSHSHRLLIAASMSTEESVINNLSLCDDVLATIDCLRALGVKIELCGKCARVVGIDFTKADATEPLNCRESGSTIRFLIPLAMLSGNSAEFIGKESLLSRPFDVYEKIADEMGLTFERNGGITVKGPLTSGIYSVRGDISSQFVSGLLFALSLLNGDSVIRFTTEPASKPYIDLTISTLAKFGVEIVWNGDSLHIKGGQRYSGGERTVEGDWSGAAFLEALNYIGGKVIIDGLKLDSEQADKAYLEHFKALNEGYCNIDIENCPDLAPILFTMAAIKHGARFTGTKRLKIKESDRAEVMREELSKLGADVCVMENEVVITKTELKAASTTLYGHNDHRIVMSLAVVCSIFGGEIEGSEAISKSYPEFFDDLSKLGIKANETR